MRLPSDTTPLRASRVCAAPRVSWLIATSRLYSDGLRAHQRSAFAEDLTAIGVKADPTRISRWESGAVEVPDRAVAGYNRLLGLRPGHLLTVAAGVRRSLDPDAAAGVLAVYDVPHDQGSLDDLFARFQDERHTGVDWTLLAASIEAQPGIYLPTAMWSDLCARLLRELPRSSQLGWIRRYEAARTFVRHPGSRRTMVKAIGAQVTAPGAQLVEPAISLLQDVEDPHVTTLLVLMLATGPDAARRGAAWTLAAKLNRGQLDEEEVTTLGELVPWMLLRRGATSRRVRSEAMDILSALPEDRARKVLRSLVGVEQLSELHAMLDCHEILPPGTAGRLASEVARRVELARTTDQYVESDDMLARLIREALFHVQHERRHHASVMLSASPYSAALSGCLLDALSGVQHDVLARALKLVGYLRTGGGDLGRLLTWARHYPVPWLRNQAIATLGHSAGPLDEDTQRALTEMALHDDGGGGAAVYALGMKRSEALVRVAQEAVGEVASCARWWLEVGPPIDDEPAPAPPLASGG